MTPFHPARRRILQAGLLGAASLSAITSLPALAQARAFPTKPVRMVVAFAPGGAGDFLARLVQQHLQERWGQSVVVENKPGASGTIGADLVAKAAADGHTLLVTNQLIVQAPNAIAKMPYDVMRDLTPVVELGGAPLILAVNASPRHTAMPRLASPPWGTCMGYSSMRRPASTSRTSRTRAAPRW